MRAWEQAAVTLAQIQLSHIDHTTNLLATGALDWTLPIVLSRAKRFSEHLPQLMALQPETARAKPLTTTECAILRLQLPGVIGELFGGLLPMTIVHGDLNPGNIFVAPNQCSILDWAETYVSHPFIGFELLAAHRAGRNRRRRTNGNRRSGGATLRGGICVLSNHPLLSWLKSSALF